jgi:hypothetical protein
MNLTVREAARMSTDHRFLIAAGGLQVFHTGKATGGEATGAGRGRSLPG